MNKHYEIIIKGLVQGVGFRPFIYSLAHDLNLAGRVENNLSGVRINLLCTSTQKDSFLEKVRSDKPKISFITEIDVLERPLDKVYADFQIIKSSSDNKEVTRISADMAVCDKCLSDYRHQPHRIHYPFVNCTHCGPRFSIIESIPYDRPFTTMKDFVMCDKCQEEYNDPLNRRFHAQPIACNYCGPYYIGFSSQTDTDCGDEYNRITNYPTILTMISDTLKAGGIVALKGMGGFNWLVDARNDDAVSRLRRLKRRDKKPFAIMVKDEKWVRHHTYCSEKEFELLNSWRRPIVILNEKDMIGTKLNGDLTTIGVMLPYMPIHYHLFELAELDAIVFTSANKVGEPMLCDNVEARDFLLDNSDFYVEHNRRIHNRVDDSVVRVIHDTPQILRRARGYVPEPIANATEVEGGIAFGAEMTAVFAIGKKEQIIMGQYIGDLSDLEVFHGYRESLNKFISLFKVQPTFLIADTHPGYFSTKLAEQLSREWQIPLYKVQHHFAHTVSVMVEYGLTDYCLALSMDGTGYGDDGASWGCELLYVNRTQYQRLTHLPYVSLPGGDKAAIDCWRMALSYMYALYGSFDKLPSTIHALLKSDKIRLVEQLLRSDLNQYQTSSAGRLFDAVSALLGLCMHNSFQAEAALATEHSAYPYMADEYSYFMPHPDHQSVWNLKSIFDGVLHDLNEKQEKGRIAMRFHRSMVDQLYVVIDKHSHLMKNKRIILTGGVCQNRLLSELLIDRLNQSGYEVYYPTKIPCNDGGIAVGQLAIAAALRNKNNEYA